MNETILTWLFAHSDADYAAFQRPLLPTLAPERVIGVRTPALRSYAAEIAQAPEIEVFLTALPHFYFEENQLHGFVISREKDFETLIGKLDAFLPYVDNWATCDQLSPAAFKRHRQALLPHVFDWLASDRPYTMRFSIKTLMDHYLETEFSPAYPEMVAAIRSEEYYVQMMVAWYFATALAKQYDAVLPYLTEQRLPRWTHNKAISKAVESRRITEGQKTFLKTLRRKETKEKK